MPSSSWVIITSKRPQQTCGILVSIPATCSSHFQTRHFDNGFGSLTLFSQAVPTTRSHQQTTTLQHDFLHDSQTVCHQNGISCPFQANHEEYTSSPLVSITRFSTTTRLVLRTIPLVIWKHIGTRLGNGATGTRLPQYYLWTSSTIDLFTKPSWVDKWLADLNISWGSCSLRQAARAIQQRRRRHAS